MNSPKAQPSRTVFERNYEAQVEELWELWTTKKGFESWWGPEGFRVEVHELDARVGGKLSYDMIADAPEQIEAMRTMGQPISHGTTGTFAEVRAMERLVLRHLIDFIPGLEPYPHEMAVEFSQQGVMAHMRIIVDAHHSQELNRMATMGMESQLTKLPGALAARRV
jgi:uncharacterized protein YndB with AHSA1/START domain